MDIKNSKMRKLILSFLFVLSAMVGFAQSFSKDKLFISVEGGKGVLFGKSNLSPFGIGYRGGYDGGLMCNVKALYRIDKFWVAGLKFNLSGTSANYALDDGTNVADNVDLWYLGPQLGFKIPINERTFFSYVLELVICIIETKGVVMLILNVAPVHLPGIWILELNIS